MTTIIVGRHRTPHAVLAYIDRIEDEFEAARAGTSPLPADQGYAHLYPGDPRLRMSALRLLVPRE
jgi:hypothetical protein